MTMLIVCNSTMTLVRPVCIIISTISIITMTSILCGRGTAAGSLRTKQGQELSGLSSEARQT